MGSTSSKEYLMAKAIENHDIDYMKILMKDLTTQQKHMLCNSLVPKNENQCTIFHYAIWQGRLNRFRERIIYIEFIYR
jgi:hypothetical protein